MQKEYELTDMDLRLMVISLAISLIIMISLSCYLTKDGSAGVCYIVGLVVFPPILIIQTIAWSITFFILNKIILLVKIIYEYPRQI